MTVMAKKIGGSVAVVIPKAVAREMELADGTTLELSTTADAIIMRPRRQRRNRRPLAKIVSQMNPASYRRRRREGLDDSPIGKEIW